MKILIDRSQTRIEAHAIRVLKHLEEQQFRPHGQPMPIGFPSHSARYPVLCDECGATFWANDTYAVHQGCKGIKLGRVGFGHAD